MVYNNILKTFELRNSSLLLEMIMQSLSDLDPVEWSKLVQLLHFIFRRNIVYVTL